MLFLRDFMLIPRTYTHTHVHACTHTCTHTHSFTPLPPPPLHTHTLTQSYCPKHTALRRSPSRNHLLSSPHKNDMLHRPTQLIQVQESFYKYASVDDLIKEMKLSPKLGTLIYNYWKLKRKVSLI